MNEIPLGLLFGALVVLLILSAFFSGSETGLMALNRYRLRQQVKEGNRAAIRAQSLLDRPDRLLGLILFGNNLVNIFASTLAAVIAIRLLGEVGLAIAPLLLTFVVLIFAEVAPKTVAALHPERVAFPASIVLVPLLWLLYPVVFLVNVLGNGFLRLIRVPPPPDSGDALSPQELRTVVLEAGTMIPKRHQHMLLSILDLAEVTVEDIMIPRNEVTGLDINDDWETILEALRNSEYSRIVVYRDQIDNVVGFLHLRKVAGLMLEDNALTREQLEGLISEPYFIPEGTPLQTQLLNFQKLHRRIGLVVDEYGDLLGLVTLEDILEEIVGEFTTDPSGGNLALIKPQGGGYLVDAGITIRGLNRALGWHLPVDGPKTLNGLIMEYLENIPEPGVSLELAGHPVEIVRTSGNRVESVLIRPAVKA